MESKLLLVDEYPLFGHGIKYLLKQSKLSIQVVEIAQSKTECLSLARKLKPDITIVNIDTQISVENLSKLDYIKSLKESNPFGKIVVIIKREFFQLYFNELIQHGVTGFMTRNTEINHVVEMLQMAVNGQIVLSKELSQNMINVKNVKLTNKEIDILKLIYEEKTNKEIASMLNYSIGTVEYYLTSIFNKLAVRSRVGAVREANNMGLL